MVVPPGCLVPFDHPPTAMQHPGLAFVPLVISRGDIEGERGDRLVEFVDGCLSTVDQAQRLVGKGRLTIDGYNEDPRDLTQIPEVRKYFQRTALECPLLPFLCEPVREEMLLYVALVGDGRRVPEHQPHPTDPWLCNAKHTMFSSRAKLGEFGLAYGAALGQWLFEHGLLEQEEHPLWKAHERSLDCLVEILETSGRRLKPVS